MVVSKVIAKYQSIQPKRVRGINVYDMPKTDLVRLVQKTEGNSPCFKGDFASQCGQTDCLWFKDCKDNRK